MDDAGPRSTGSACPDCSHASWRSPLFCDAAQHPAARIYACLLLIVAGGLAVPFTDRFLYMFHELALVPTFWALAWGDGPRRVFVTRR